MANNPPAHVIRRLNKILKGKQSKFWDDLDREASREGAAIKYMKEETIQPTLGRFLIRNHAAPTFKSPKSMQGNRGYC